ncbi:MAG: ATP-binding cassette domain-containing protein [Phycisphaerales bacterium]|nr:ATP-binding cassette domain-containing protein [Phycisphaerales bacterium]
MRISVAHDFLPKHNSVRAAQVMDHFGIDFEHGRHVIAADLEIPIEPGQVVLFTGASGSGKSSLMRALSEQLNDRPPASRRCRGTVVVVLELLPLPDGLLVDSLNLPAGQAMNLLSSCGLGEAHLMLRTPTELSDGQRYRFRLALALSMNPQWIVADEFTATLDRTLAQVVAFNVRRLADRTGTGFLLATTHEDVTTDLAPDVHVHCRLDGEISIESSPPSVETGHGVAANHPAPHTSAVKKKEPSPSPTNSGSPRRPDATGRTSLGGITAATTSG